jgi:hypothetical protein
MESVTAAFAAALHYEARLCFLRSASYPAQGTGQLSPIGEACSCSCTPWSQLTSFVDTPGNRRLLPR